MSHYIDLADEIIAAALPTCDARTGEAPGDYGMTPIWCNVRLGLRTYTDNHGVTRRFCAAHEAAVRGRYPEARAELERGTATFDAPGCYFCQRTAPILDGLYTAIDFGGDIGIQHVCDDCNEKAE